VIQITLNQKMKKIAILTSGGDAPGMNAAIRSIIKTSLFYKLSVLGVLNGYEGLIDGQFLELNLIKINDLIQRGGTILKSARSNRFFDKSYRKIAYDRLRENDVDGLIVLGGDGTFRGASDFSKEFNIPIIGIPCTIDNDLVGTDFCIGYDTATNTAMDAIDKIRDTAESHNRIFFVEVMGRDAGWIALRSGIAGGADVILIPETEMRVNELVRLLKKRWSREKSSLIVAVAEGDEEGNAFVIAKKVKKLCPDFDIRVATLGHIQRGGKPSCMDRVLASRMGLDSVETLLRMKKNVMVGIINQKTILHPLDKTTKGTNKLNTELLFLSDMMSQ
jgi:6-phosphofructokinase 1